MLHSCVDYSLTVLESYCEEIGGAGVGGCKKDGDGHEGGGLEAEHGV